MKLAEALDPPNATTRTSHAMTADELRDCYLDEVYAFASRRLPRREDAEDVTAETFQSALTCLHKLKGADPKLWLFGIARRKVADTLRRRSRQREQNLGENHPSGSNSHELTEREEAATAIRRIVLALPEDQREALLLQHLERLSQAEIATVMGRSQAAINSLLQRARARAYEEGKSYFVEETR